MKTFAVKRLLSCIVYTTSKIFVIKSYTLLKWSEKSRIVSYRAKKLTNEDNGLESVV